MNSRLIATIQLLDELELDKKLAVIKFEKAADCSNRSYLIGKIRNSVALLKTCNEKYLFKSAPNKRKPF